MPKCLFTSAQRREPFTCGVCFCRQTAALAVATIAFMVSVPRASWIVTALMISAMCLAQSPPTVTRFEQSDPRITYTGTWYPNSDTPNSGGSAVLANLKGSQAVVTFNGTGVTWIGVSDPFSGIAYLDLDG